MKIALISKPPSGKKKLRHDMSQIIDTLEAQQIECDLFETEYHAHALKIVEELPVSQYDALVAVGGDGTNYHVLNGLLKFHADKKLPIMGIIPVGRGNSFARDLNIHSIEDGLAAVLRQKPRAVDVCRFRQGDDTFYFVNLMGLGFVTDVAQTAAGFSWMGDLSYVVGVLHRTIGLKFHELELEIDGKHINGRNCFVEFCNSRYTGGSMLMAPGAEIDDGYFDVVILEPLSRWNLLKTFPKIFKGTHVNNPQVTVVRAKKAIVRTSPAKVLLPDGEIFGVTPAAIDILPQKIRYFT